MSKPTLPVKKQWSIDMKMNQDAPVIITCAESHRFVWEEYVRRSPSTTLAHSWGWRSAIEETYGHKMLYLMAERQGIVRGILPLVLVKSPLLGISLTSMPFLDCGGVSADDTATEAALLDAAGTLQQTYRARCIELRHAHPIAGLPVLPHEKATMVLDLTSGEQRLWTALPAKVRNQVRKAEKSGLTVTSGGHELISDFYDVFVINMRDLGSPVHSRELFVRMAEAFGSAMRITLVRDRHKTVGGLVSLFFKDTMLVPWASSLREYFSKCPNNLLYWRAIEQACERGCKTFDFGRSSVGSGTYEFKRQWGSEPLPLHWQVISRSAEGGSAVSAADSKFRIALEAWKRLPVGLTRILGPRIRKYLTN